MVKCQVSFFIIELIKLFHDRNKAGETSENLEVKDKKWKKGETF